jgi:hypothetical protein
VQLFEYLLQLLRVEEKRNQALKKAAAAPL